MVGVGELETAGRPCERTWLVGADPPPAYGVTSAFSSAMSMSDTGTRLVNVTG